MVRIELVRDKIRRLRATVAALRDALPANHAGLYRDALDLVSFRVYLGLQEAIDLASHLIADEGWARRLAYAITSRSSLRRRSSSQGSR
jgi:hypothetical protein